MKHLRNLDSFCLTIIWMMVLLSVGAVAQSGGSFTIQQSVIASGGGTSNGGGFTVESTTGQSLAGGPISNEPFNLFSGFWTPASFAPTPTPTLTPTPTPTPTITPSPTPTATPTPTPTATPTPSPTPTPGNTCTPSTTVTEGDLFPGGIVSFGVSSGSGTVTVDHVNAGTGLQSLTVVGTPTNAMVSIPSFTLGTFLPVVITFIPINPNLAVDFKLRAASTFHAANIRVRCGTPPNEPEYYKSKN